jgi:hypothetical protein
MFSIAWSSLHDFLFTASQECLTASEIQAIKEINEMGLPLHVQVITECDKS